MTTLVLVHGAWHGAWCYELLGKELDRLGVPWVALDLPSSHDPSGRAGLAEDTAAIVAAASDLGPVTLVAHSYGGAPALEAAPAIYDLASIIFVAALVPEVGEGATAASRTVRVRTALDEAIRVEGDLLRLDPALAGDALYGQCSAEVRDNAIPRLGPQTLASFAAPRQSRDVAIARHYLLCTSDRALDPSLQAAMAERCDTVARLESDHSPFLSMPEELATRLALAAGAARPA